MPSRPPQHRPSWWKPYKEEAAQVQRRQARRALATNSARWRKIRAAHLSGEPLCRECASRGLVVAATDVDHMDGDDSNNAPENLQSLCHACHSRKTARENGGFGRTMRGERDPFDGMLLDAPAETEQADEAERVRPNLNGPEGGDRVGEGQSRTSRPSDSCAPRSSRFRRI